MHNQQIDIPELKYSKPRDYFNEINYLTNDSH